MVCVRYSTNGSLANGSFYDASNEKGMGNDGLKLTQAGMSLPPGQERMDFFKNGKLIGKINVWCCCRQLRSDAGWQNSFLLRHQILY